MFCPKCNSLMLPARKNGKKVLKCRNCGYEVELSSSTSSNTVFKREAEIEHGPGHKLIVLKGEVEAALPKALVTCPRCGHHEAYYWEQQTRSGDEPMTRFFRCTKCGYTWREYE